MRPFQLNDLELIRDPNELDFKTSPGFVSLSGAVGSPPGSTDFVGNGQRLGYDLESFTIPQEGSKWFWDLNAYRVYFNVTTNEVKHRLKMTVFTSPRGESFWDTFHSTSDYDLYGPFWVSMTLLLVLAMSGNFANRIDHYSKVPSALNSVPHSQVNDSNNNLESISDVTKLLRSLQDSFEIQNRQLAYDPWIARFESITSGAGVIALSVLLPSAFIWSVLTYIGTKFRFFQIVSLIGYSYTPFLISGALCWYPISALQWMSLLAAGIVSSRFTVINLKQEVFQLTSNMTTTAITMEPNQMMHTGMLMVVILYIFISVILKFTFF